MKKICIYFLTLICVAIVFTACSQPFQAQLDQDNTTIKIDRPGTVDLAGPSKAHIQYAHKAGMEQVGETTFRAAIILTAAFSKGDLASRGKVFNMTNDPLTVTCSFLNDSGDELAQYTIDVKPHTFSRMIPDDAHFKYSDKCTRIVCKGS